jgi:hypothetical protein
VWGNHRSAVWSITPLHIISPMVAKGRRQDCGEEGLRGGDLLRHATYNCLAISLLTHCTVPLPQPISVATMTRLNGPLSAGSQFAFLSEVCVLEIEIEGTRLGCNQTTSNCPRAN